MIKQYFKHISWLLLFTLHGKPTFAQKPLPGADLSNEKARKYALLNASLHQANGLVLEQATILIKGRRIEQVGKNVNIPAEYMRIDLDGKHVYPGFIDLYGNYGMASAAPNERKMPSAEDFRPKYDRNTAQPLASNEAVRAEKRACEMLNANEKEAEELLKLGFTTQLTGLKDGIFRGTWTLYNLGNPEEKENFLAADAATALSFMKGSSRQSYPSSQMGAIALIRQTLLDADWYEKAKPEEKNISLEAINRHKQLPIVFEAKNKLEILRFAAICKEFGLKNVAIKTNGDEYQRAAAMKQTGAHLIVPLQFPAAFQIDDVYDADMVEYADLKHWEAAPYNARFLKDAGVPFSFTLADLKDKNELWKVLKKLHETGLSEADLLQALSIRPAGFLGMSEQLGKIEKGFLANLIITDKAITEGVETVYETWAAGSRNTFVPIKSAFKPGVYQLTIDTSKYEWTISGNAIKPESKIVLKDTTKTSLPIKWDARTNNISFNARLYKPDSTGETRFSGFWSGNEISGIAVLPKGGQLNWSARYIKEYVEKKQPDKKPKTDSLPQLIYPFEAYGQQTIAKQGSYLIKNATIWTSDKEGVLQNADIFIADGKIKQIGRDLKVAANVQIIDGTGKHVTPGLIDEHSHIAISKGVNEGSHNNTAEVRIGDVVNSEDINIFRHLSGGVTLVQQLHGSANCIGGQSNLLKLKWGYLPEEMKLSNQPKFIKFALGENVKQSNWGDFYTIRYPQTRMGVEQVYYDAFINARNYAKQWAEWQKSKGKGTLPRRDLKYETLVEILDSKRFITCHSYVQSEINMLMKVADSLKFRLNTFTHILEGYKVADKMRIHGANASTFADWWAYKMEVNDAIPYNAAMLHKAGVNTCINSDDAEMARRLNQEAAKAIKYGGISEEDALKMVTINPAKALRIDDRTGSLKPGKDADIVIWNASPLSQYAVAEKTFVDGILFFDREEAAQRRAAFMQDKNRLIQKTLQEKKTGAGPKPSPRPQRLWHCEDLDDFHLDYDEMP
jgi:imidazolonepropionase-like amidohydrolase